jgi:hypothetical protein
MIVLQARGNLEKMLQKQLTVSMFPQPTTMSALARQWGPQSQQSLPASVAPVEPSLQKILWLFGMGKNMTPRKAA